MSETMIQGMPPATQEKLACAFGQIKRICRMLREQARLEYLQQQAITSKIPSK